MRLSKLERAKRELPPHRYLERLGSLDAAKLTELDRFYLKNFGIYSTKLHPDRFMVRVRIPGGRLSPHQARAIAKEARELGAKLLLTARAQIELHGLELQDALETSRCMDAIGLSTLATLTDNLRNIVTDPYDGCEGIECYPIVRRLDAIATKRADLGMLPRKCNTAVVGTAIWTTSYLTNDILFAAAKKDGVEGFRLYLGGKHSHFAQDSGIFVEPQEVEKVFAAVVETYRRYGPRESRTKARLWHLLQYIGMDGFLARLAKLYEGELQKGGEPLKPQVRARAWVAYGEDYIVRKETRFGEISPDELEAAADAGELRLGIDQNLYLPSSAPPKASRPPRLVLVCAGERHCIFSLFDTKAQAWHLPLERLARLGVRVGYSGCLKGCGRHIATDIGLVGIRTNAYGEVERGVRLYLGGLYSDGSLPARLIFWAVPLRKLGDVIGTILDLYEKSGYDSFEAWSRELADLEPQKIAHLILNRLTGGDAPIAELDGDERKLKELEKKAFGRE